MNPTMESHTICTATTQREGSRSRLIPADHYDLAHAPEVERELETVERELEGSADVDLDLGKLDHIDGAGAVLLARLVDRLHASGQRVHVVERENPQAARLIALYRERRGATRPGRRSGTGGARRHGKLHRSVRGGDPYT
jgi:anti-anti-sigma regulatory factor